jgi:uncharacterized membrane protein
MNTTQALKTPQATISGSYGYSWQQMWKYFLYLFLVIVLIGIAQSPGSALKDATGDNTPGLIVLQLVFAAYWLLVLPVLEFGADLLFLRAMRNEKIDLKELFIGFQNNYLNIVLAHLIWVAIVGIGIVFLIVPGIILACRLAFIPYLVMDKNMEPVAAVEKSWEMTRGHGWKIFGMALLAILIAILGILCLIVGIFFALIWISGAFAALYHAIDLEQQKELNENGAMTDEAAPEPGM